MSKLIGLYSPAPQSGKSTVAGILSTHNFLQFAFAQPLKFMIEALFEAEGFHKQIITEMLYGPRKEQILPEGYNGHTPRSLLQTLGTEWGRKMIHPDIWVHITQARIGQALAVGDNVVIDDMRFPNEFQMIKDLGGKTIKIVNERVSNNYSHCSEGALNNHSFDLTLTNDSTLKDLEDKVLGILKLFN